MCSPTNGHSPPLLERGSTRFPIIIFTHNAAALTVVFTRKVPASVKTVYDTATWPFLLDWADSDYFHGAVCGNIYCLQR